MKIVINKSVLKRHIVAIVSGIVVLILAGVTYVRSSAINQEQARWQTMTRQIAEMDANLQHAHGIQEQVLQLEAALIEMETFLFDPNARALNTNFFYQLEQKSNVRIVQARQGAYHGDDKSSEYANIEFVLLVEGNFTALLGFIYQLYSINAFIVPKQWELQTVAGREVSASNPIYSLSLTVRVLAQKTV
jgi:hypothetical protein